MITESSMLPIQSHYELDGKPMQATVIHELPLIVEIHQFLEEKECDTLISLSEGRLERSKLATKAVSDYRTSSGAFLEENLPMVAAIERRISELLQIPVHFFEGLQILHYEPGQQFAAHFDYFGANHPSSENNRICTLIMYLNDVEAGGETSFPELNLSITPRKGNAVYFEYFYQDASINERTLHCGEPVIRGEKWIATQWVRRQTYRE